MQRPYGTMALIGRFQLPHNAHMEIVYRGLQLADKLVIIVGSSYKPRTIKNPWTYEERSRLLRACIGTADNDRVIIVPMRDTFYNNQSWEVAVHGAVMAHADPEKQVVLTGFQKEDTGYLESFPQWGKDFIEEHVHTMDATQIRELYFKPNYTLDFLKNVIPEPCFEFLKEFRKTDEYKLLVHEKEVEENYKKPYANLPYGVIFSTVDAVVFQSGHVLLVKRRAAPGKGLWALPGGFVDAKGDSSVLNAMLRELEEETKIDVPVPVLKGNIVESRVFDHIDRSSRGRTITHAFKIVLPNRKKLPKIKGSDDAEKAKWVHLSEVKSEEMFDDHYDIIEAFKSGL